MTTTCLKAPLQVPLLLIVISSSLITHHFFAIPILICLDELNALAISMMSPTWSFLSAECKSDMKRLTCAQIYKPTRNDGADLPYRKPCKSLCDATSYLGTSCAGMMEGFGTAVNCWSDSFDLTNDLDQCNAMTFSEGALLVAQDQEAYIGTTCQGIIDTAPIATPAVDTIDPLFAPYLPPYVAQSIIEGTLAGWTGSMPVMAHGNCLTDFRKMACGLMLPAAEITTALEAIFGPITLPSFPHHSVCTEFMDSCDNLLSVVPSLAMNCSGKAGDVYLFPNATQTIAAVNLGFGDILLQTEPNKMASTTLVLETECPNLLVVPEDPTGKYVNWIDGYNCALECQFQVYPEDFTDSYFWFFKFTQWVSLAILTVALINLQVLTSAKKRNPYLQLILSVLWIQGFFSLLLVQNRSLEEAMCKDNAQFYSYEDADTSGDALVCTTKATFSVIHDSVLYFMFIAMTSELYSRVILEAKDVTYHKRFYIYGAGSFLFCLTLLQLFYPEDKNVAPVEGGWSIFCFWKYEDPMIDYWMFTFPKIVIYVACSTMSIFTAYRTLKVTQAVSGSFKKMWQSYRVLYVSLILFVGTFPLLLFMDKTYFTVGMQDKYSDANEKWFQCIITEFIGGNTDYMSTCGDVAEEHYPFAPLYLLLAFYYIITPLGNLWASFSNEARKKWYASYMKVRTALTSLSRHRHEETKVVPAKAKAKAKVVIDISQSNNVTNKITTPPSTDRAGESGGAGAEGGGGGSSEQESSAIANVVDFSEDDQGQSSNKYKV